MRTMRTAGLQRLLQGVLLVGAPFALGDCLFGMSSCPDDGVEPPRTESLVVSVDVVTAADCRAVCGDDVLTCVSEGQPGLVMCVSPPFPCEGRRPVGLRSAARTVDSGFARHLADAAWLEAASVDAFGVLRRELRAHGAPRRLLRAASRSKRDERRHARATKALAKAFGVEVAPVERDAAPLRSLAELALENAVEGCVRETWGALLALRQASRAREPAVRATMRRIARDEARHAQLAWAVDTWLCPRLSPAERQQVLAARRAAVNELARDLRSSLPLVERERLGLPGAAEATVLLAELDRSLGLTAPLRS
jgi:hypothetical protein